MISTRSNFSFAAPQTGGHQCVGARCLAGSVIMLVASLAGGCFSPTDSYGCDQTGKCSSDGIVSADGDGGLVLGGGRDQGTQCNPVCIRPSIGGQLLNGKCTQRCSSSADCDGQGCIQADTEVTPEGVSVAYCGGRRDGVICDATSDCTGRYRCLGESTPITHPPCAPTCVFVSSTQKGYCSESCWREGQADGECGNLSCHTTDDVVGQSGKYQGVCQFEQLSSNECTTSSDCRGKYTCLGN